MGILFLDFVVVFTFVAAVAAAAAASAELEDASLLVASEILWSRLLSRLLPRLLLLVGAVVATALCRLSLVCREDCLAS